MRSLSTGRQVRAPLSRILYRCTVMALSAPKSVFRPSAPLAGQEAKDYRSSNCASKYTLSNLSVSVIRLDVKT